MIGWLAAGVAAVAGVAWWRRRDTLSSDAERAREVGRGALGKVRERVGASGAETGDGEVEEYIREFPYQETYDYSLRFTDGEPARLNTWVPGSEPVLVKAGQDKVVRTNNDTFYKMAFVDLAAGPVVLRSDAAATDRFVSFQLMDDRNGNFHNVIHPDGAYTLHRATPPTPVEGEAIQVPSTLSVVIVRVEVKDKDDPADVAAAEKVFNGITIDGPTITEYPILDRLSRFDERVVEEAEHRLDEALRSLPFLQTVVGPGEEPGVDVPFLNHAAGTKSGWGGPGSAHSAYETIFTDAEGDTLDGSRGVYTLTTEEPPVDAFWSLTVYDTARGGLLHPNANDRYHINNTTATRNPDGTVTFTFTTHPGDSDPNALEVPDGQFDVTARYYLPGQPIRSGDWTLPRPQLR